MVFYLVASPEQEAAADWGEQVGVTESYRSGQPTADRHYFILYARNDEEERSAAHAILNAMIGLVDPSLIDVIDLRDVLPGGM
jgi:hypothetical protein